MLAGRDKIDWVPGHSGNKSNENDSLGNEKNTRRIRQTTDKLVKVTRMLSGNITTRTGPKKLFPTEKKICTIKVWIYRKNKR